LISKNFYYCIAALLLTQATAWAGTFAPACFERGVSSLDAPWPTDQPIRACLIRVEFQPDSLTGTTGNGTFGSGFPDSLRLDPLPHDRAYFEDHLAFLQHYYTTASKGTLEFSALDVYPQTVDGAYRLAFPMWHYNFNSDTALLNRRLVELFAQSVELADADVDLSAYDAVMIVHAGVGKDFNVGFDATPFDIPSAYISPADVHRFFGSLPSGVTRGLILPEAQNQDEVLQLGVELSMNGVMIKLFGNWLGMPDLYNTETGASGIGRWGMMDQGSGNVNAIVPALPDAWSRLYMGWADAQVISLSGHGDTLRIGRFGDTAATEIVKVSVTDEEYYLLENRDADADSIGFVSVFDRNNREMRIDREGNLAIEEGFRIPVRASHYDFGIPGSGILIWKINEDVIAEKIDENRVNADPANRGVDLVEADGSQDIGREYGFATAGSGTELGIQEDCWYRDNRPFREANGGSVNVRFNDNTRPSARLQDHSFTFMEISEFSDVGDVMTCRVRGTLVEDGFPVTVSDSAASWALGDLDNDGYRETYVKSHDSLFVEDDTLGLRYVLRYFLSNLNLAAAIDADSDPGDELYFFGKGIGKVGFSGSSYWVNFPNLPLPTVDLDRLYQCRNSAGQSRLVFFGTATSEEHVRSSAYVVADGELNILSTHAYSPNEAIDLVSSLENAPAHFLIGKSASGIVKLSVEDSLIVVWENQVDIGSTVPQILVEPFRTTIFVEEVGYIDASDGNIICAAGDCDPPQVDWDGDGRADGGGPDGAESAPREDYQFDKDRHAEAHDLNFDGQPDLLEIALTKYADGTASAERIAAYDHQTHLYEDFPVAVNGVPVLVRLNDNETRRHVVIKERVANGTRFSLMRLPVAADGTTEEIYQAGNMIFIGAPRPQVHDREDFVYVWPNPASSVANIRLTLPFAATADVKLFDLVGREVATLSGSSSQAGFFEIPWNTSAIGSGVYIGRVEAQGGGQTRSAEIKIAVVR